MATDLGPMNQKLYHQPQSWKIICLIKSARPSICLSVCLWALSRLNEDLAFYLSSIRIYCEMKFNGSLKCIYKYM